MKSNGAKASNSLLNQGNERKSVQFQAAEGKERLNQRNLDSQAVDDPYDRRPSRQQIDQMKKASHDIGIDGLQESHDFSDADKEEDLQHQ